VIADGVAFGMLEAHGRVGRDARPWAAASGAKRSDIVTGLSRLAQRPGAERLAPIPFASSDGPVTTGLDVAAEIARQRAQAIAGRVH
jgi:hypothetical protein